MHDYRHKQAAGYLYAKVISFVSPIMVRTYCKHKANCDLKTGQSISFKPKVSTHYTAIPPSVVGPCLNAQPLPHQLKATVLYFRIYIGGPQVTTVSTYDVSWLRHCPHK